MTKGCLTIRGAFCALALLVCSAAYTSTAQAQGVLRFVSGTGNDANDCLRPTPCRSINRGVQSAPAGAEVIILDSAGYGPTVTVDKSITITAPSGVAATIACVAANNSTDGFRVAGAGTSIIRVSNSAATNNTIGFRHTTGTFESRGNNTVRGNTVNTVGTITPITGS